MHSLVFTITSGDMPTTTKHLMGVNVKEREELHRVAQGDIAESNGLKFSKQNVLAGDQETFSSSE